MKAYKFSTFVCSCHLRTCLNGFGEFVQQCWLGSERFEVSMLELVLFYRFFAILCAYYYLHNL